MLESLLLVQKSPLVKGDITFKTSSASSTTITTSSLGTGFTVEYGIDEDPLTPAGDSFVIPAGEHDVTLKLIVTTGTSMDMAPFKDILTEVIDWEGFQLSNIQFRNCAKLTKVPEQLPASITDMGFMFQNCSAFNQDIGGWDVGSVTNMMAVFFNCISFNQDIGQWNTSNVTHAHYMFQNCTSFNQDISDWDVGQMTNISYMFQDCTSFNQDLSSMVFKSNVARAGYDAGATAWNAAYRPKFTG